MSTTNLPTVTPTLNTSLGSGLNVSSTEYYETEEEINRDFWIGLILAVSSSGFIGTSFILTKLGLLNVGKKSGARAGKSYFLRFLGKRYDL